MVLAWYNCYLGIEKMRGAGQTPLVNQLWSDMFVSQLVCIVIVWGCLEILTTYHNWLYPEDAPHSHTPTNTTPTLQMHTTSSSMLKDFESSNDMLLSSANHGNHHHHQSSQHGGGGDGGGGGGGGGDFITNHDNVGSTLGGMLRMASMRAVGGNRYAVHAANDSGSELEMSRTKNDAVDRLI